MARGLVLVSTVVAMIVATAEMSLLAERHWQTGTWGVTTVPAAKRPNVHPYVIETNDLRLELKATVPAGRRPLEVTVGAPVTFALERNTVYVRNSNGGIYKLRVVKKIRQARPLGPTIPTYAALGGGHLIRTVSREGRYVTLEDGSVWEIDPVMWFETVQWEPSEGVTVRSIPEQDGFIYELDNTSEDAGAPARYIPANLAR